MSTTRKPYEILAGSAAWTELKEWIGAEIAAALIELEAFQSGSTTTQLRARLKVLREMLKLGDPPPPKQEPDVGWDAH